MKYKWIYPVLLILGFTHAYGGDVGRQTKLEKCMTVHGTLALWNGWPPFERIESDDHKHVYGVESAFDGDDVPADRSPANLKQEIGKDDPRFHGTFVFCLNSQTLKSPDEDRTIELGWIKSFKPSD